MNALGDTWTSHAFLDRLGFSAVAVYELLICAKRRVVRFRSSINQLEVVSKLLVHALSVVAHDVQSAALLRAVQSKGGINDVAARLHGSPHRPYVLRTVGLVGEKMKIRLDHAIRHRSCGRVLPW